MTDPSGILNWRRLDEHITTSGQPTADELERIAELGVVHVINLGLVNARVSAFFYRYRRERLGVDERVARAELEAVWRPGGVWAAFIGDRASVSQPHRYARRDY